MTAIGEGKWKFISIRTVPELKSLVAQRAERDGLEPSVWAREVLAGVAAANVTLPDLVKLLGTLDEVEEPVRTPVRSQPGRRKLGARVVARPKCLHPMHLRQQMVSFDLCHCGKEFPR